MAERINPKVLAATFTIMALFFAVTGMLIHGFLGLPSLMNKIIPGFWDSWTTVLLYLIGGLVYAYVSGYIFALVYNWKAKKLK